MKKFILSVISVPLAVLILFCLFIGVGGVYDGYILGEKGVIQNEGLDSLGDVSGISVDENEGFIYEEHIYVKELYVLAKAASVYKDEAGHYYLDESYGELVEEYYTVMLSDSDGNKYITYMVVNADNKEIGIDFESDKTGKPMKIAAFLKSRELPNYEVYGLYTAIDESIEKSLETEKVKELEYNNYVYVCETQEQYDVYVRDTIEKQLSGMKTAGVTGLVLSAIFILLLVLITKAKKAPIRKPEEVKTPERKIYDAESTVKNDYNEEFVFTSGSISERKGVYKEKLSAMETLSAKMEKLKGKHSVNKSRASSGMEFEDEMRK